MSDDQKRLQSLSDEYQKVQTDLQGVVTARQKLESQEQENLAVQKVFDSPGVSTSQSPRGRFVADE